MAFSPNPQWSTAGTAIRAANMNPEPSQPSPSVRAVMSPAAVPSANVVMTVAQ